VKKSLYVKESLVKARNRSVVVVALVGGALSMKEASPSLNSLLKCMAMVMATGVNGRCELEVVNESAWEVGTGGVNGAAPPREV